MSYEFQGDFDLARPDFNIYQVILYQTISEFCKPNRYWLF